MYVCRQPVSGRIDQCISYTLGPRIVHNSIDLLSPSGRLGNKPEHLHWPQRRQNEYTAPAKKILFPVSSLHFHFDIITSTMFCKQLF